MRKRQDFYNPYFSEIIGNISVHCMSILGFCLAMFVLKGIALLNVGFYVILVILALFIALTLLLSKSTSSAGRAFFIVSIWVLSLVFSVKSFINANEYFYGFFVGLSGISMVISKRDISIPAVILYSFGIIIIGRIMEVCTETFFGSSIFFGKGISVFIISAIVSFAYEFFKREKVLVFPILKEHALLFGKKNDNDQLQFSPQEIKNARHVFDGHTVYAFCLQERRTSVFKKLFSATLTDLDDVNKVRRQYEKYYFIFEPTELPFDFVLKQLSINMSPKSRFLRHYISGIISPHILRESISSNILSEYGKYYSSDKFYVWLSAYTKKTIFSANDYSPNISKEALNILPNDRINLGYRTDNLFLNDDYIKLIENWVSKLAILCLIMLSFGVSRINAMGEIYILPSHMILFSVIETLLFLACVNLILGFWFKRDKKIIFLSILSVSVFYGFLSFQNWTGFVVLPSIYIVIMFIIEIYRSKPSKEACSGLNELLLNDIQLSSETNHYRDLAHKLVQENHDNILKQGHTVSAFIIKENRYGHWHQVLGQENTPTNKELVKLKKYYQEYGAIWSHDFNQWLDFEDVLLVVSRYSKHRVAVLNYLDGHNFKFNQRHDRCYMRLISWSQCYFATVKINSLDNRSQYIGKQLSCIVEYSKEHFIESYDYTYQSASLGCKLGAYLSCLLPLKVNHKEPFEYKLELFAQYFCDDNSAMADYITNLCNQFKNKDCFFDDQFRYNHYPWSIPLTKYQVMFLLASVVHLNDQSAYMDELKNNLKLCDVLQIKRLNFKAYQQSMLWVLRYEGFSYEVYDLEVLIGHHPTKLFGDRFSTNYDHLHKLKNRFEGRNFQNNWTIDQVIFYFMNGINQIESYTHLIIKLELHNVSEGFLKWYKTRDINAGLDHCLLSNINVHVQLHDEYQLEEYISTEQGCFRTEDLNKFRLDFILRVVLPQREASEVQRWLLENVQSLSNYELMLARNLTLRFPEIIHDLSAKKSCFFHARYFIQDAREGHSLLSFQFYWDNIDIDMINNYYFENDISLGLLSLMCMPYMTSDVYQFLLEHVFLVHGFVTFQSDKKSCSIALGSIHHYDLLVLGRFLHNDSTFLQIQLTFPSSEAEQFRFFVLNILQSQAFDVMGEQLYDGVNEFPRFHFVEDSSAAFNEVHQYYNALEEYALNTYNKSYKACIIDKIIKMANKLNDSFTGQDFNKISEYYRDCILSSLKEYIDKTYQYNLKQYQQAIKHFNKLVALDSVKKGESIALFALLLIIIKSELNASNNNFGLITDPWISSAAYKKGDRYYGTFDGISCSIGIEERVAIAVAHDVFKDLSFLSAINQVYSGGIIKSLLKKIFHLFLFQYKMNDFLLINDPTIYKTFIIFFDATLIKYKKTKPLYYYRAHRLFESYFTPRALEVCFQSLDVQNNTSLLYSISDPEKDLEKYIASIDCEPMVNHRYYETFTKVFQYDTYEIALTKALYEHRPIALIRLFNEQLRKINLNYLIQCFVEYKMEKSLWFTILNVEKNFLNDLSSDLKQEIVSINPLLSKYVSTGVGNTVLSQSLHLMLAPPEPSQKAYQASIDADQISASIYLLRSCGDLRSYGNIKIFFDLLNRSENIIYKSRLTFLAFLFNQLDKIGQLKLYNELTNNISTIEQIKKLDQLLIKLNIPTTTSSIRYSFIKLLRTSSYIDTSLDNVLAGCKKNINILIRIHIDRLSCLQCYTPILFDDLRNTSTTINSMTGQSKSLFFYYKRILLSNAIKPHFEDNLTQFFDSEFFKDDVNRFIENVKKLKGRDQQYPLDDNPPVRDFFQLMVEIHENDKKDGKMAFNYFKNAPQARQLAMSLKSCCSDCSWLDSIISALPETSFEIFKRFGKAFASTIGLGGFFKKADEQNPEGNKSDDGLGLKSRS